MPDEMKLFYSYLTETSIYLSPLVFEGVVDKAKNTESSTPVIVNEAHGQGIVDARRNLRPAKTTSSLTGLTPDATIAKKTNPKALSCRNNRVPVFIILCPGAVALARSCGHRKSEDLHPFYTPAGSAIHSLVSISTKSHRLLPSK
ncbi:hypothetical protein AVEN_211584-1 [Araneus ventricosus]|uniref:Uncharacterized protein n=1 Tax=Araneus ventricosus TaxID=182803 RepID=A0A4Y2D8U2_ARAVE|nr:hypothetical protein AVEN_211584-1 [Araneus ventricosus]